MYGASVDKYMCTPLCPCDVTYKAKFESKVSGSGLEISKKPN